MRRPSRLSLDELRPYLIELPVPADPTAAPPPLDWATLFGNDRPVELEVGFGKGLFLLTSALASPETNFAGVEIERKYVLFTATRIAKRHLSNVRLAHADARTFLRDRVPDASLHAVHVYFPDPWWKKRHHKRRVFTEAFARECVRVLKPGGVLNVATDVAEYFEIIRGLLSSLPNLSPLPAGEEPVSPQDVEYRTNFERKARAGGNPVHRASWQRVCPAAGDGR